MHNQYGQLLDRSNMMYMFINLYNGYMNEVNDYGTGQFVTMVESHTLSYIEENPGVTNAELALHWRRTKGAISQTVLKLVSKGLVERVKKKDNAKEIALYPTPAGIKLSVAHKSYDIMDVDDTMKELRKACTDEEIAHFFKVMGLYIDMLK